MYYAILAFIAASSLWMGRIGDSVRLPKEIACILGFLTICVLSGKRDILRNIWAKAFVIWGFVLVSFLAKQLASFYELFYVTIGIFAMCAIADSSTFLPNIRFQNLTIRQVSIEDQIRGIARFVCVIAIFMSTYIFIQALGWDSRYNVNNYICPGVGPFTHRIIGTMGNPTVLASWLAITLPCFFLQRDRMRYMFWYCLPALLLTQGRVGIFSLFMALTIIAFYKNKKLFVLLFITGTVLTTLVFTHSELKTHINPRGRLQAWKIIYYAWCRGYADADFNYYDIMAENRKRDMPAKSLYGHGPGMFKYLIPQFTDDWAVITDRPWMEAHNEPVEIAFNYGVVGVGLYLGFCLSLIWKFLMQPKDDVTVKLFAILVAFFITNLFFFPLHMGGHAFLVVCYTGFLMNLQRRKKYVEIKSFGDFCRTVFTCESSGRGHPIRNKDGVGRWKLLGGWLHR